MSLSQKLNSLIKKFASSAMGITILFISSRLGMPGGVGGGGGEPTLPLKKAPSIENRIYREEFTGKKCKSAILLYCFHTAGVLHIFMLYKMLSPGISFYRKSKIIVKRKPNYEIGWFHN